MPKEILRCSCKPGYTCSAPLHGTIEIVSCERWKCFTLSLPKRIVDLVVINQLNNMLNIDNNWKTKKVFSQNNNWKNKIRRKGLGEAPQETSANIFAPELALRDNRFTGRTKQLGLRVKPEFTKKLKTIAAEEDCLLIEVLEKALDCYDKQRKN